MSFREINHKNNEEYWERLELVMERIEAGQRGGSLQCGRTVPGIFL